MLWTSVFALLSGISLVIASHRADPRPYLGMCLPIAFGFISVPAAFKFSHARLIAWAQNVNTFAVRDDAPLTHENAEPKNWVMHELSFFGGSVRMYAAGIVLALWSLFAFYLGNYFDGLTELEVGYLCSLIAFSAGLAGFGLDAIFSTSRLIWRFGQVPNCGERAQVRRSQYRPRPWRMLPGCRRGRDDLLLQCNSWPEAFAG
jgi:hypothetical protein